MLNAHCTQNVRGKKKYYFVFPAAPQGKCGVNKQQCTENTQQWETTYRTI